MDEPVAIPARAGAGPDERALREGLQRGLKARWNASAHPATGACPAPADTDMARFWAGNFGAQWNQVLRDVAVARQLGIGDTARLLALANLAAADAGIGIMGQQGPLQRSGARVTAIRPTAAPTATSRTAARPPIAGSAVHLRRPLPGRHRRTPPYPDYVSGANGLTGAYTTLLQLFFTTDCHAVRRSYKASPPTVAICTNAAALSPVLGCGGGGRRCTRAARYPLPLRGHRGTHARHARRVAHVHERAAPAA